MQANIVFKHASGKRKETVPTNVDSTATTFTLQKTAHGIAFFTLMSERGALRENSHRPATSTHLLGCRQIPFITQIWPFALLFVMGKDVRLVSDTVGIFVLQTISARGFVLAVVLLFQTIKSCCCLEVCPLPCVCLYCFQIQAAHSDCIVMVQGHSWL